MKITGVLPIFDYLSAWQSGSGINLRHAWMTFLASCVASCLFSVSIVIDKMICLYETVTRLILLFTFYPRRPVAAKEILYIKSEWEDIFKFLSITGIIVSFITIHVYVYWAVLKTRKKFCKEGLKWRKTRNVKCYVSICTTVGSSSALRHIAYILWMS